MSTARAVRRQPKDPSSSARIRWGAWFAEEDLDLDFPSGWNVRTYPPAGGRDIGVQGIADALACPIGTAPIRELAKAKLSPCIVIDDLSRPTPGHRLLPPILSELQAAGIPPEDVLVLAGVANHRPMMRADFIKKCGTEVVKRCRIKNHFSWDDCVYVGTTTGGIPVSLNSDFMASDLRILVGSIVPHSEAGFGGGAKLVLPGVASIDTATRFHGPSGPQIGLAGIPPARLAIEEAAHMGGVDCIVNAVPNSRRGIAALVVGDVVEAHREGVRRARQVFRTHTPEDADLCVLSAYPKDNEFLQYDQAFSVWRSAPNPIVHDSGTVVVATASSEGAGFHSLGGPGMRLWPGANLRRPVEPRDLLFFSPGVNRNDLPREARDDVGFAAFWPDAKRRLAKKHGRSAEVAIFPCAAMQLAEAVCE